MFLCFAITLIILFLFFVFTCFIMWDISFITNNTSEFLVLIRFYTVFSFILGTAYSLKEISKAK